MSSKQDKEARRIGRVTIAPMYSNEEYEKKHKELIALAHSVEVWRGTPQSPAQQKKVNALFERLHAETFALECKLLELKSAVFTEMLAVLKKEK